MIVFQIFGSASSIDLDLVVFVEQIPATKAAADLCFFYKNELKQRYHFSKSVDVNIVECRNGVLQAVHKGTVDELNNTLFYTYNLHEQFFPQQIEQLLPRSVDLKMIRCSRKILSFLSRTSIRTHVKKALRGDFKEKIDLLSTIQWSDFSDFGKKGNPVDFRKMLAFQLGQTLALMNGIELYTKEGIIQHYPDVAPFLMREQTYSMDILQKMKNDFIKQSIERLPQVTILREI